LFSRFTVELNGDAAIRKGRVGAPRGGSGRLVPNVVIREVRCDGVRAHA
jgi:hypothetical protein